MSEEIIKVLDELCKRLGIVVDWTSENVIPYLQTIVNKIIKLEIVESIMGIIYAFIFLGIAFGLYHFAKFCFKKDEEDTYSSWNIGGTFSYVGTVVFTIVFLVIFMSNIWNIVECIVFPEKVVFDFVRYYIEVMN